MFPENDLVNYVFELQDKRKVTLPAGFQFMAKISRIYYIQCNAI